MRISIPGDPVPQGSMRTFPHGGMAHSNGPKVLGFRADVKNAWGDGPMHPGGVLLFCTFVFARPKSHYHPVTRKRLRPTLRPDAPFAHTQKPDVDKLLRGVMDALTGSAYADDCQVVQVGGLKVWGIESSTIIDVEDRS